MYKIITFSVFTLILILVFTTRGMTEEANYSQIKEVQSKNDISSFKDNFWKDNLTELQYKVSRKNGTEYPFTGKYNKHYEDGDYYCSNCGEKLFSSDAKFNSKSGWPSFYESIDKKAIKEIEDNSFGMKRVEIKCDKCDAHLGHIFDDGPKPTGLRYCVNSVSLVHEKDLP